MTRQAPFSIRDVAVPTTDPIARKATPWIGGPVGRYARVGPVLPWQTAAAALTLVAAGTMTLGMFSKGHCVANGWVLPDMFWRACYSDLPFLYSGTPLVKGEFPYAMNNSSMNQPPLTGTLMWLVGFLLPAGEIDVRQRWYFLLWGALLMGVAALLVRVVARMSRRHPWRAAHVAASPVLVTVALVSSDLVGVTLAAYGLFLWSRRRPEWAGILFGIAIATRSYPILFVLVIGLLALRAGRIWEWAAMAGSAMLAYVGSLLAVFLAGVASGSLQGISEFGALIMPYRQWFGTAPDYGSLWFLPRAFGQVIPFHITAVLTIAGWFLALLAGAYLALCSARRPTVAEVSLVVFGIVMITGRALPVQSALWLLPLIALARLPWRDHLIWASAEVLYFVAIWLYLGGESDPSKSLPLPWMLLFSVLRILSIAWLVTSVWRQVRQRQPLPEPDPQGTPATGLTIGGELEPLLTMEQEPDDLAGPFSGLPDRMTVAFR